MCEHQKTNPPRYKLTIIFFEIELFEENWSNMFFVNLILVSLKKSTCLNLNISLFISVFIKLIFVLASIPKKSFWQKLEKLTMEKIVLKSSTKNSYKKLVQYFLCSSISIYVSCTTMLQTLFIHLHLVVNVNVNISFSSDIFSLKFKVNSSLVSFQKCLELLFYRKKLWKFVWILEILVIN